MQEAQAVCAQALHEGVVHVVLLAAIGLVALFPVAANAHCGARGSVHSDDVGQADAGGLAVIIGVLKALQVPVDLELQQFHFLVISVGADLGDAVGFFLDDVVANVSSAALLRGVQVLATQNSLVVVVHRHRHNVRDARALAHDARAVVWDVQVVRQDQLADHAILFLVEVHLLERRAAVAYVEQQLIKVRGVLFHHRGDLVVHEVAHAVRLHQLLACLFAQHLCAHRTACRQQFLERLGLELHDRLSQQWVGGRGCAFEWLGALIKREAQEFQALAVLLFPILARALVRLKQRHEL